jgi:probable HAF family extracellular repeat protein
VGASCCTLRTEVDFRPWRATSTRAFPSALAFGGWIAAASGSSAASTFTPLGDLAGGEVSSTASAISPDGLVVVGWSSSENGVEAFRWTLEGGMEGLGDLPGGEFSSRARDVSAEGLVVVGGGGSERGEEGFRCRVQALQVQLTLR